MSTIIPLIYSRPADASDVLLKLMTRWEALSRDPGVPADKRRVVAVLLADLAHNLDIPLRQDPTESSAVSSEHPSGEHA